MAGEPQISLKLGGKPVDIQEVFEITVELDLDQPDMAAVVVSNIRGSRSANVAVGDPLEVNAGGAAIFKGEVTGLEPTFDHSLPSRCTIRALNRMHRLARGRKSRTFEHMTDQDIVTKICREVGLSASCDSHLKIKHDHVYQGNQTDLEFIRQRAARIDYEVIVDDTKLFFRKRQTDKDSGIKLDFGGESSTLVRFRPRLSTANQVAKVVCRGWDPIKRKEIIGVANADAHLGGTHGAAAASLDQETVETDRPIYSQEEANAVAKAILKERQMHYITGDAFLNGTPGVKPGLVVTIDVMDPRFNGKYYVASARHRYVHSTGGLGGLAHKEAGYRTFIKVLRDASGEIATAAAAASGPNGHHGALLAAGAAGIVAGAIGANMMNRHPGPAPAKGGGATGGGGGQQGAKGDPGHQGAQGQQGGQGHGGGTGGGGQGGGKEDGARANSADGNKSGAEGSSGTSDKTESSSGKGKASASAQGDAHAEGKATASGDESASGKSKYAEGSEHGGGAAAADGKVDETGRAQAGVQPDKATASAEQKGHADGALGAAGGEEGKGRLGSDKNNLTGTEAASGSATAAGKVDHDIKTDAGLSVDQKGIHEHSSFDASGQASGAAGAAGAAAGGVAGTVFGKQVGGAVAGVAGSAAASATAKVTGNLHASQNADMDTKGNVTHHEEEKASVKTETHADVKTDVKVGAGKPVSSSADAGGGNAATAGVDKSGNATADAKTDAKTGGQAGDREAKAEGRAGTADGVGGGQVQTGTIHPTPDKPKK